MIHTPAIRVLTRTCAAAALVLYLVLGAAPKAAAAEPVRGNETSAERIRSAIAAIFSAAEAAIAAQSLPVHENVDDVIDLDPEAVPSPILTDGSEYDADSPASAVSDVGAGGDDEPETPGSPPDPEASVPPLPDTDPLPGTDPGSDSDPALGSDPVADADPVAGTDPTADTDPPVEPDPSVDAGLPTAPAGAVPGVPLPPIQSAGPAVGVSSGDAVAQAVAIPETSFPQGASGPAAEGSEAGAFAPPSSVTVTSSGGRSDVHGSRRPAPSTAAEATLTPVVLSTQPLGHRTLEITPLLHSARPATEDRSALELAADAALPGAGLVIAGPRMANPVAVAIEFGRAGHGWAGALVFNVWLRRQMRERRMSQRQLAQLAGVNHATISRLLSEGRSPSLKTATRLAHALRLDWNDEEIAAYFDLLSEQRLEPTRRVEAALRGDDGLTNQDVRDLMAAYLRRRLGRRSPLATRAPGEEERSAGRELEGSTAERLPGA